jgi:hypothetical protein
MFLTLNHLVLVRIQVRQLLNTLQSVGHMGRSGTNTWPLDTNPYRRMSSMALTAFPCMSGSTQEYSCSDEQVRPSGSSRSRSRPTATVEHRVRYV